MPLFIVARLRSVTGFTEGSGFGTMLEISGQNGVSRVTLGYFRMSTSSAMPVTALEMLARLQRVVGVKAVLGFCG